MQLNVPATEIGKAALEICAHFCLRDGSHCEEDSSPFFGQHQPSRVFHLFHLVSRLQIDKENIKME